MKGRGSGARLQRIGAFWSLFGGTREQQTFNAHHVRLCARAQKIQSLRAGPKTIFNLSLIARVGQKIISLPPPQHQQKTQNLILPQPKNNHFFCFLARKVTSFSFPPSKNNIIFSFSDHLPPGLKPKKLIFHPPAQK